MKKDTIKNADGIKPRMMSYREAEEYMEVGYLLNRGQSLSELGEIFVESLKAFAD